MPGRRRKLGPGRCSNPMLRPARIVTVPVVATDGPTPTANLSIAELSEDPYPALHRVRATKPVCWVPALGGWLVTSHELALQVLKEPGAYTVDDARFSTARVIGPSMLSLDGVGHTHHRAPFVAPFQPKRVAARFRPVVETATRSLIDSIWLAGTAELCRDFAGPLAVAVIADALGLAGVDPSTLRRWYQAIVATVSAITSGEDPDAAGIAAFGELTAKVEATIRTADSHSLLATAARTLTTKETVSNVAVMLFGGIETTEAMICNAIVHLLTHDDQLTMVRADPTLIPAVIEESIRLEPAAAVVDRYATRPLVLGATQIAAGDLVRISITAANRDPAVFPIPDRFDVRRTNTRLHLGFARGPHFCIGMDLARAEAQVSVENLLIRLPGLRLLKPATPAGLVFRKPPEVRIAWSHTR